MCVSTAAASRPAVALSVWTSVGLAAGSTLSLTNNTFGGMLYCTLPYVSQLQNNASFGAVDISGGTLSQDVTLSVLATA